jgi:hypothetical protein
MLKEYDLIQASKNITEKIKKGCNGTILSVHERPKLAYEVEFFNTNYDTIDVITVKPNDIEERHRQYELTKVG